MRIIIHYNGVGYCYAYENGQQITKYYSSINRLVKYKGIIKNMESLLMKNKIKITIDFLKTLDNDKAFFYWLNIYGKNENLSNIEKEFLITYFGKGRRNQERD